MESRKFRFKEQRPPGRTYHRQIKREEWDRYKNVIGKMHEAKCPRNEILRRLKEEWDFDPSLSQLNAQMRVWGLRVYSSVHVQLEVADPTVQCSSNILSKDLCLYDEPDNEITGLDKRGEFSVETDSDRQDEICRNTSRNSGLNLEDPQLIQSLEQLSVRLRAKLGDLLKTLDILPVSPFGEQDLKVPINSSPMTVREIFHLRKASDFLYDGGLHEDAARSYFFLLAQIHQQRACPDLTLVRAVLDCARSALDESQLRGVKHILELSVRLHSDHDNRTRDIFYSYDSFFATDTYTIEDYQPSDGMLDLREEFEVNIKKVEDRQMARILNLECIENSLHYSFALTRPHDPSTFVSWLKSIKFQVFLDQSRLESFYLMCSAWRSSDGHAVAAILYCFLATQLSKNLGKIAPGECFKAYKVLCEELIKSHRFVQSSAYGVRSITSAINDLMTEDIDVAWMSFSSMMMARRPQRQTPKIAMFPQLLRKTALQIVLRASDTEPEKAALPDGSIANAFAVGFVLTRPVGLFFNVDELMTADDEVESPTSSEPLQDDIHSSTSGSMRSLLRIALRPKVMWSSRDPAASRRSSLDMSLDSQYRFSTVTGMASAPSPPGSIHFSDRKNMTTADETMEENRTRDGLPEEYEFF